MGRIIVARANQQMVHCKLCGQPAPAELVWRGALCQTCWGRAGQEQNWVNEPCSIVTVEARRGLPVIQHCREFATCDSRLAQHIAALVKVMAAPTRPGN